MRFDPHTVCVRMYSRFTLTCRLQKKERRKKERKKKVPFDTYYYYENDGDCLFLTRGSYYNLDLYVKD